MYHVTEIFHIFYGNSFLNYTKCMYFTEKEIKLKNKIKKKKELLEFFLPEKFRNFHEITEIFHSTKVTEAHLLHA